MPSEVTGTERATQVPATNDPLALLNSKSSVT